LLEAAGGLESLKVCRAIEAAHKVDEVKEIRA
jgi:hypothetical protein